MIDSKVVIAALARDCNRTLQANIERIESLRSFFRESFVVVVENDSVDGTKMTLEKWEQSYDNIHLIVNNFGSSTIPIVSSTKARPATSLERIEKMARYRNFYIDYIRSRKLEPEFLIVVDLDILEFSVQGIIKSIREAPSDWNALFAFGLEFGIIGGFKLKRMMYDMFAYIHDERPIPFTANYMFHQKRKVVRRIENESFSKCTSAFGGVGVYNWKAVRGSRYLAERNNDTEIEVLCEHIPFNAEACKEGCCYISKYMFVNYGKCPNKVLFRMMVPEIFYKMAIYLLKLIRLL